MSNPDLADLAEMHQDCENCGADMTLELDINRSAKLICDKCGSYFYTDDTGDVKFQVV